MMYMYRQIAFCLTAASLIAVTGCTSSTGSPSDNESTVVPLTEYAPKQDVEFITSLRKIEALVKNCMRSIGNSH